MVVPGDDPTTPTQISGVQLSPLVPLTFVHVTPVWETDEMLLEVALFAARTMMLPVVGVLGRVADFVDEATLELAIS